MESVVADKGQKASSLDEAQAKSGEHRASMHISRGFYLIHPGYSFAMNL